MTSVFWLLGISSCASLNVRSWFLDGAKEGALVRRDQTGAIKERLTFYEADGYRCYSENDDSAWRARLIQCCAKAYGVSTE
jgi:hypothetical protein